jgi:uncharacterized protein (TIGR02284 family)
MDMHTELIERIDDLAPHERKNVAAALQELLATCHDATLGYVEAAKDAKDPELSQLLSSCALEHEEAGNAIAKLLLEMNVEPHVTHSFGGELHRRLIALRSSLGHGEAASLLPECERGEHVAISRYEKALSLKLPIPIADTLLDLATACRERRAAFDRMRHPW